MFIRNSPQPEGTPNWITLNTPDLAKASKFYRDLFGWKIEEPSSENSGFLLAKKNGYYVAGIVLNDDHPGTSDWKTYLATDNIDETLDKISLNDGQILEEPVILILKGEIKSITAMAKDSGGAEFGLWEAKSLIGMEVWEEYGSIMWSEQFSAEPEKCKVFYKAVFTKIKYNTPISWHFGDPSKAIPGYTMYSTNGDDVGPYGQNSVASIGQLDPQDPIQTPHWMPCFTTINIQETIGNLQKLGGKILIQPYQTMFGLLAIVRDNQGAAFMLAVKPDRSL